MEGQVVRLVVLMLLAGCAGTGDPIPDGDLVGGTHCASTDKIGDVLIGVEGGAPQLSAEIYDAVDPRVGPAELVNDTCAFHRFQGECTECAADTVCSFDGECVPQRLRRRDARVEVVADGKTEVFEADLETGLLWGQVGAVGEAFALTVTWGDQTLTLPETTLVEALDVAVVSHGDYDAPGALDATWTPPADGGFVGTVIPINHHAQSHTFTACQAPASAGSFTADAEMVDPLAVITGLEFQGVQHYRVAAAETSDGCVEVRLGTRWYVDVRFE